jgi:hypothetical protein
VIIVQVSTRYYVTMSVGYSFFTITPFTTATKTAIAELREKVDRLQDKTPLQNAMVDLLRTVLRPVEDGDTLEKGQDELFQSLEPTLVYAAENLRLLNLPGKLMDTAILPELSAPGSKQVGVKIWSYIHETLCWLLRC